MNTENAKTNDGKPVRGWIYYDAACAACVRGRNRTGRLFESRGFRWLPLQTPGAAARLGVAEFAFETRMHLLTADGVVRYNADAFGYLCRSIWWLWPVGALLLVPGIRELGRLIYDWFARHRYHFSRQCRIDEPITHRPDLLDWLVAGTIAFGAARLAWDFPAWAFMWTFAIGLGMAGKWLTWRDALLHGARPSPLRATGWFLLWPGLDGRAFLSDDRTQAKPGAREWLIAAGNSVLGAALVCGVVPLLWEDHPLAAAWAGMTGIVFCLHFGVIRLLSLAWRLAGVDAQPIMHAPIASKSLAEFWGRRWNTAFSIPAHRLLFLPVARRLGVTVATGVVFLASGLLHELVISLPAGGGFGRPTLYFLLQTVGVFMERSRHGRGLGLGRGAVGWLFTLGFTLGPAFLLFHAPFIERVMLPFLALLTNH